MQPNKITAVGFCRRLFCLLQQKQKYSTQFSMAREKALKAEILKDTPKPPAGNGGPSAAEYQQKIAEAQANGDFTAVAYYTRLAAQASQS